jgi:CubicO group peptidase (beta-lactamase class C family)
MTTPSAASLAQRGIDVGGGARDPKRHVPEIDELAMKARIGEILNRWPAVGLAVGVVRDGSLELFHGHGVADIASNTPITEDTVFRIASITKTFTAIAVMQLYEQGLVDLDAPANDYLRAYQLIPAKASFRPATVRHLLTHAAGIPQMVLPSRALTTIFTGSWLTEGGESFKLGQPLPTLAEYYRGGLRLVAEPGTRFTYSDHGFATLGQLVEDVSGKPLDRYFRERIFEPLGMADTDLVRSDRVASRLATGYSLRSNGAKAVTDREWVTAGASSIYSTARDMARYLAALQGGGTGEHGSVLEPATLASMFEPHYQTDPRVPGIGLAFFRANLGGHLAVEHQGILPGFNSQIWVAPRDGVGVMAFANGARQAMMWLPAEAAGLLKRLLGVPDEVIRTDVPHHPEIWGDICGWYRVSAQMTDMQARGMAGLGAKVFVRRGQLMLRALSPIPALYRGFRLHPDDEQDPYVFRIDLSEFGIGTARVVFSRDPKAGTTSIHLDLAPLSLHKQAAMKNPRWRAAGVVGALGVATTAIAARRRRIGHEIVEGPPPRRGRPVDARS